MKWKNTTPPKDRKIIRYHILWKCPIAISWWKGYGWITTTKTRIWPEETFAPEWSELPEPPPSERKKRHNGKDGIKNSL